MDISKYTTGELWQLYYQVGWEISKRLWWMYVLIILVVVIAIKLKERRNVK